MTSTATRIRCFACLLALTATVAHAQPQDASDRRPADKRQTDDRQPADTLYLLHLPGVGGELGPDRRLVGGFKRANFPGPLRIYDWTGGKPGLEALLNRARNDREAAKVAEMIKRIRAEHPDTRIVLSSHSGGAGIAVWALEKLPADVQIDTLLMLSPALSQRYDLSAALRHVRGKAYAFTSVNDAVVLGAGTRLFGTIDGVKEEAAGRAGFTRPQGADAAQYEKLVQFPYTTDWIIYENIGDHIGYLALAFAEKVLAPLVTEGKVPVLKAQLPATRPTRH